MVSSCQSYHASGRLGWKAAGCSLIAKTSSTNRLQACSVALRSIPASSNRVSTHPLADNVPPPRRVIGRPFRFEEAVFFSFTGEALVLQLRHSSLSFPPCCRTPEDILLGVLLPTQAPHFRPARLID
jgi:hypothetical protein